MKIVAFVGYQASGKSEATRVTKSMGIPVVVMGDVVREETRRRRLPQRDEYIGEAAKQLREKEGMDAIAKRCIPVIRDLEGREKPNLIVVDGIRGAAETAKFREVFRGDFTLVRVESPADIRYQRMKKRGRSDMTADEESFAARDAREEGFGMGEAMKIADEEIENTGTLEQFRGEIRKLLEKLTSK